MTSIPKDALVFVAGHAGLVGSAIMRRLQAEGCTNVLVASRAELDLRDQSAVNHWFRTHRPEFVFLVAGTVGGIGANASRPAEFLYDNMMIHATVVQAAHIFETRKLLYLGSSCIYPRDAVQPITEDQLLTGPLEPTNEYYAIAKISGIKLCQSYRLQHGCNFISAMPTNLYGPNDNFDLDNSHVLPALLRKFHEAKVAGNPDVVIWGSGHPRREFLHVDDLAAACLFLMHHYSEAGHINVGTGRDISILRLAEMMRDIIYPEVEIVFDSSKPDGMPRKVLDCNSIRQLGWVPSIELRDGIRQTYEWFLSKPMHEVRGGTTLPIAI
jgi:GDP-L-fucose synthase